MLFQEVFFVNYVAPRAFLSILTICNGFLLKARKSRKDFLQTDNVSDTQINKNQ